MSRVAHVTCPVCGAPIGVSDLCRIVRCAHCGGKLLVEGHHFVGEYYVEPALDRTAARRRLQQSLSDKRMPRGLLRGSRLHTARLCFVPYNEVFAKRVGRVIMRSVDKVAGPHGVTRAADTRIVVSDVERRAPADLLGEWGLDHAAISHLSDNPPFTLLPATRRVLSHKGFVCQPSIPPERILDELEPGHLTATFNDNTEYTERRYRRLFYPVWRIQYQYNRRFYFATVDGVTGALMSLRAPENDNGRLKWLLGAAMFAGLVLGKGLQLAHDIIAEMGLLPAVTFVFHPLIMLLALLVLAFLALLLSTAWEQFRFAGELVITGDQVEVVKLNRPPGEPRITRVIVQALTRLSDAWSSKQKQL